MHIKKITVFGINFLHLTFVILQLKECSTNNLEEKCSGKICIPSDYDRLNLPNPNEVNNINIEIFHLKFLKVNDNTCIIKTSFWFVMNWHDPRLIKSANMDETYVVLEESFHESLWLPDIMIWDLENVHHRHFLNKDKEVTFYDNNSLSLATNILLETYCPMTFESYPIDDHICGIYFTSFGYNNERMNLTLSNLHFIEENNLLDYSFDVKTDYPTGNFWNHSETGLNITLKRNMYKYVANYYVPTGLLVSISWVSFQDEKNSASNTVKTNFQISFVIHQDAVPGRIGLLITIFLVLINIFINVTSNSPNTKTLTNISGWIIGCIFFVHCALVEYGCLLFFKHVSKSCAKNPPEHIKNVLKKVDLICLFVSIFSFHIFVLAFVF